MSVIWNDRVARFHAVWFTSALWSRASASTLSPSRLKCHLNFAESYCLLQNDKCTLMFVFLSLTRSWQSFKCAFLFSRGQTLILEESDSAEKNADMYFIIWRKINNTVKEITEKWLNRRKFYLKNLTPDWNESCPLTHSKIRRVIGFENETVILAVLMQQSSINYDFRLWRNIDKQIYIARILRGL